MQFDEEMTFASNRKGVQLYFFSPIPPGRMRHQGRGRIVKLRRVPAQTGTSILRYLASVLRSTI